MLQGSVLTYFCHNKSWICKQPDCDNDKRNISVVIWDADIIYGKEHEQTYHYLQNIHHHLIQPKTESSTVGVHKDRNFTTKEMISIFPLWTFHLFVATFQQHLRICKQPDCDNDKRNISVIIWDADIPYRLHKSWFEEIIPT
jgi:hypothetical protein